MVEVEVYVYKNYIQKLIVNKNGINRIYLEDIEKLKLEPHQKDFIMKIIHKINIAVVKKTNTDHQNKDNDHENIEKNKFQEKRRFIKLKEKHYQELDCYLEKKFIPTYVEQIKNTNKENKSYKSISLHHVMGLNLSIPELKHVINYLKNKNIILDYKDTTLSTTVQTENTLSKIKLYNETKDEKLLEEIILENMGLVHLVANTCTELSHIEIQELESYGFEGLLLAIKSFRTKRDKDFLTYTITYIKEYILKSIIEIKLGRNLEKKYNFNYNNYNEAKNILENAYGIRLSEMSEKEKNKFVETIINLLIATDKIKEYDKETTRTIIMQLENINSGLSYVGIIEEEPFEEEVFKSIAIEIIEQTIDELDNADDIMAIKLYSGLYDGNCRTITEIAEILGINYEKARNHIERAAKRLRHPSRSRKYRSIICGTSD